MQVDPKILSIYGPDHREPVTLLERLAYALCAQDYMGGEGHLTDNELESLEMAISTYGIDQPDHKWAYPLLNLVRAEHAQRATEGRQVALMHFVWRDWPSYMEAAKTALHVLSEIPEVGKQFAKDSAA